MKILKSLILIILFSILIAGCSSADQSSKANNGQLKIFTTLYPIQYAVERIGGDTVAAKTVYPPGVDAHSYEPTTKDITAIADSTAFIYLGAGMESFAESAAEALAKQDVQLIEIGEHEELFHVEEKIMNMEQFQKIVMRMTAIIMVIMTRIFGLILSE